MQDTKHIAKYMIYSAFSDHIYTLIVLPMYSKLYDLKRNLIPSCLMRQMRHLRIWGTNRNKKKCNFWF